MEKSYEFKSGIKTASGPIEFNMTNDFMFRSILEKSELVLKGLISSLLHIPFDEIGEIHIENPIELGDYIDDKTFMLDIKVKLVNQMIINLEMQVINRGNWRNRSLSYLCRNFDNLQKGDDYDSVIPVVHVGILDFDLFEDDNEFYSCNKMTNIRTNRVFNDNMTLNVLYLNRVNNATDEDKRWKIDRWARLFKAKTWEELRMAAEFDMSMVTAADMIFKDNYNTEENLRDLYRLRQDNINHERRVKQQFAEVNAKLAEAEAGLAQAEAKLSEKDQIIADLKRQLAEKNK